jgi:hypothetical protein
MQTSTNTIRHAARFEFADARPAQGFFNSDLFCVKDAVGVFRRVPRSARTVKVKRDGAVLAEFNGALIELVRFKDFEAELEQAGFRLECLGMGPVVGDPPDESDLKTVLKKSIEQVQQKQKAGV